MHTEPESTLESYYDALRRGDPLTPYFDPSSAVKFGVRESSFGADSVRDALREQTETTTDWTVDSHRLTVDRRGEVAWFADEVTLEWTAREDGTSRSFETRWSGTLLAADGTDEDPAWRFVAMHVSAPEAF